MEDHRTALTESPVGYHAYVESAPRAGRGLLESLAARAVALVTDDFSGLLHDGPGRGKVRSMGE